MKSAANSPSNSKRASFWAIGVALVLAVAELMSFGFGNLFGEKMYSEEDAYFASIDRGKYERWRGSPWFDADLGWNTPKLKMTESWKNCVGEMVAYSYQDEYRGVPRPGPPAVALFGDSYTFGDEVDDTSTSAAALEKLIDAPVLNYGSRGFGPDQAVLKFERLASTRELPKRAVLVIMHENIRRVVNSFRPVYYSFTDMRFGLKPYVLDGVFVKPPAIHNYDEFLAEARRRFAEDFWARPRFSFPFSVSLFRAATSNSFYLTKVASRGHRSMSYEYESDNRERQALSDVIARWRSSAAAKGVRPFVLFVPSSRGGLGLSASYVKELNAGAGETFAFEFEDPEIDWKRYNLTPKGECHPSAYGNERIALYIAKQILTP